MRVELEPAIALARTIASDDLPRLLGDLEEIRATALARLTAPAPLAASDELLEVAEAGRRLGVSVDYLYHNHARLPFVRRQGRKLLFSARGIEEYISSECRVTARRHAAMLSPERCLPVGGRH